MTRVPPFLDEPATYFLLRGYFHLTFFFLTPLGAIPVWSWCCGVPRTIPYVASERARHRNNANNRRYPGNPRLHAHRPPRPVPSPAPVHLQTHNILSTTFRWPTALVRRTWKCNGDDLNRHAKVTDLKCSCTKDSVWQVKLAFHE